MKSKMTDFERNEALLLAVLFKSLEPEDAFLEGYAAGCAHYRVPGDEDDEFGLACLKLRRALALSGKPNVRDALGTLSEITDLVADALESKHD